MPVLNYFLSITHYETRRAQLSDTSCGGTLTEIQAFQTIPVKQDDFFQIKIDGTGLDLSPDTETVDGNKNPSLTAKALALSQSTGEYSLRSGSALEDAKALALHACQSNGNQCQLVLWLGQDKPACMAVLSGTGIFRAWAASYEGKEAAVNQAMKSCQNNGQTCSVDFIVCNHG
ncbi:MAG: DUF4189 domain-containing protein [Proteobacteria bacterium]|nr:DUF4189 domain-containing protein [Pseudomonadota bacterium]